MAEQLSVYAIFHLNLAYSSVATELRGEVIRRCYRPLLKLADQLDLPLGIEASGHTLELIEELAPDWLTDFRRLVSEGSCELIGSGYCQIIGPLVPSDVNAANLRLGHEVYDRLLGVRPDIALVCEQAYSPGLVSIYRQAGYRSMIMDWADPASHHPDWPRHRRMLPQYVVGQDDTEMELFWNDSICFQKFQRVAHGELTDDEYLDYLLSYVTDSPRVLALYGNDAEIFDFRPGRYTTEPALDPGTEWRRIRDLFTRIGSDERLRLIGPSQIRQFLAQPGAGDRLRLETPANPIPVKKQRKYNVTRWALTGHDDLAINTACYRVLQAMRARGRVDDDAWRALCRLWISDIRTHLTADRWCAVRADLSRIEAEFPEAVRTKSTPVTVRTATKAPIQAREEGRFLTLESARTRVQLNLRRGLAIEQFQIAPSTRPASFEPSLFGTLGHGFFESIALGADFYSGHVVAQAPGQPKATDLCAVKPAVSLTDAWGEVTCEVPLLGGLLRKSIRLYIDRPQLDLRYRLDLPQPFQGSLRFGYVTLFPQTFDRRHLFYRTHNGGADADTHPLATHDVDHSGPPSFLVSAATALGMTEGVIELGDHRHRLRVTCPRAVCAALPMVTYTNAGDLYFLRLAFSARELDDTSAPDPLYALTSWSYLEAEIRIEVIAGDPAAERIGPVTNQRHVGGVQ